LVTRVAGPLPVQAANAPLAPGDVLLSNRWAYWRSPPRPGDVVEYRLPAARFNPTGRGGPPIVLREDTGIDRILAGPGAKVRWDKGRLTVDGVPAAPRPLNPDRLPDRLEFDVPAGRYLILPTTAAFFGPQTPPHVWRGMGLIPVEDIRGAVYLRHQPLSRWGTLR
jgi:hypothetical protein